MKVLNVCATLGVVVAATLFWKSCLPANGVGQMFAELGESVKGNGSAGDFTPIPMPDGMSAHGIVIFAPENCPSDAAKRAEALASHLSQQRIGYTRAHSANYNSLSSQEEASRVMSVMNGPIPVVYVNGKAKANPTPEEVVAEYRGGGR